MSRRLLTGTVLAAVALAVQAAPAGASDHEMRVKELLLSQGGDQTRQFIELQDKFDEPFPAAAYEVVVYDAAGTKVDDHSVSPATVGTPDETQPILIASTTWQTANPTPPATETLSLTLPQDAGQVCFTRGASEARIDCMTYGCIDTAVSDESPSDAQGAVPPDGQSAQRQANDTTVTLGTPTPKAANGAGTAARACPPAAPTFTSGPNEGETITNSEATFTWTGAEPGGSFQCSVNGATFGTCSSPRKAIGLSNGLNTFEVRQLDNAMTVGDIETRNFTVDVIGPPADITVTGPPGGSFNPAGVTPSGGTRKALGSSFTWKWGPDGAGTLEAHNVRQDKAMFRSGETVLSQSPYSVTPSAGSYHYYCELHGSVGGGMDGTVEVIPIRHPVEPAGLPFKIAWADGDTTTGTSFDVRYSVNDGPLKTWLNDTGKRSGVFGKKGRPVKVRAGREYEFQVRSQMGKRKKAAFSPELTVVP